MTDDLKKAITGRARELTGTIGIALHSLKDSTEFYLKEQEVFHAASVIKIALLIELFRQVDRGGLSLDDNFVLAEEHKIGGAGVLKELHAGLVLTVRDLAVLMTVVSDNAASNMLMDLVGIDNVNALLKEAGALGSVLRKKFMVELSDPAIINEMTPLDTLLLLKKLYEGSLLSEVGRDEVIRILCRQQYNEKIPLFLPESLPIAHKTGEVTGVRHDAAIVLHPERPYILVIFTSDLADPLEGDRAIADISLIVYRHFSGR